MARALRTEYPGAFYHVASRGNEGKDVFRSGKNRVRFLSYLASATTRCRDTPDPFESVVASRVVGSRSIVVWVQEERLGKKPADRELPALRAISSSPSPEAIRQAVERRFEGEPTHRPEGGAVPVPPVQWPQAQGDRSGVRGHRVGGDAGQP